MFILYIMFCSYYNYNYYYILQMNNKFIIYVLELEQGKYYIGKTSNLGERMTAHFEGNGSEFTKKYIVK